MEILTHSIQQPLEFLIYTSIILLIIIGIFLIKLLIDLSGLVNSMQNFVKTTQNELEPTIREIKTTLVNINQISSNVTNQLNELNLGLKKGAKAFIENGAVVLGRAKDAGKIIEKNILSGLYLLMSRKK